MTDFVYPTSLETIINLILAAIILMNTVIIILMQSAYTHFELKKVKDAKLGFVVIYILLGMIIFAAFVTMVKFGHFRPILL